MSNTAWKTDNYKFVGKAFDYAYANRIGKLLAILGVASSNSIDYELTGSGGYGEMPVYDGENLNEGARKRGFKTIITPEEFSLSESASATSRRRSTRAASALAWARCWVLPRR